MTTDRATVEAIRERHATRSEFFASRNDREAHQDRATLLALATDALRYRRLKERVAEMQESGNWADDVFGDRIADELEEIERSVT